MTTTTTTNISMLIDWSHQRPILVPHLMQLLRMANDRLDDDAAAHVQRMADPSRCFEMSTSLQLAELRAGLATCGDHAREYLSYMDEHLTLSSDSGLLISVDNRP